MNDSMNAGNCDLVIAFMSDFNIEAENKSEIDGKIGLEIDSQIDWKDYLLIYAQTHTGNTTLPFKRIQYNSIQNIGLDENFA